VSLIIVKKLTTGYWHLRGYGICNWAQPPTWPCDEETLRAHAFPEASEQFIQDCLMLSRLESAERAKLAQGKEQP